MPGRSPAEGGHGYRTRGRRAWLSLSAPRAARLASACELISHPVPGQDELRMARIGLDLLAQPRDVHVDGARRRHGVVAPHFVEQLVTGKRGAAMLQEVAQQLKLPRRELERRAVFRRFGLPEVDAHVAERVAF